jgi:hypothetical protein
LSAGNSQSDAGGGAGPAARDGNRPGIGELAADLEPRLGSRVFVELRVTPEEIRHHPDLLRPLRDNETDPVDTAPSLGGARARRPSASGAGRPCTSRLGNHRSRYDDDLLAGEAARTGGGPAGSGTGDPAERYRDYPSCDARFHPPGRQSICRGSGEASPGEPSFETALSIVRPLYATADAHPPGSCRIATSFRSSPDGTPALPSGRDSGHDASSPPSGVMRTGRPERPERSGICLDRMNAKRAIRSEDTRPGGGRGQCIVHFMFAQKCR